MADRRSHRPAWGLLVLAAALAGCQTTAQRTAAPGTPISVESIDGAPEGVRTALTGALATAAAERQVDLVEAGTPARYRVRGYLSTETAADGAPQLAFVWDVFDAERRHARRITGASGLEGSSEAAPDAAALRRIATRSMDEIVGFLSDDAASQVAEAEPAAAPSTALGYVAP